MASTLNYKSNTYPLYRYIKDFGTQCRKEVKLSFCKDFFKGDIFPLMEKNQNLK